MSSRLQDAPPREAAAGKKWIKVPVVKNGMDTYEWREVDDVAGPQWPPRGTTRVVNTDACLNTCGEMGTAKEPRTTRVRGSFGAVWLSCR